MKNKALVGVERTFDVVRAERKSARLRMSWKEVVRGETG